jgi:hypothetical protein
MLTDSLAFLPDADASYDISGSTLSIPTNDVVLTRFVANRAFRLPILMAGSVGASGIAPTAAVSYLVKKNGSTVGTVDFALGANIATFTMATATDFASGDVLTVVAPATADTTHDELAWTFKTVGL